MRIRTIILLIVLGVIGIAIWQVLSPARSAENARRQIRTGMTFPGVLALEKGWFYCFGHPLGGPKEESARLFPDGRLKISKG